MKGAERKAELKALKENQKIQKEAKKYSSVTTNPDGTVNLEIDYKKIEKTVQQVKLLQACPRVLLNISKTYKIKIMNY